MLLTLVPLLLLRLSSLLPPLYRVHLLLVVLQQTFSNNVIVTGANTFSYCWCTWSTSLGGLLKVASSIDRVAGGALTIGPTTATSVVVTPATTLSSTLDVSGISTFAGNVIVSGTNTLTVGTGLTTLGGSLKIGSIIDTGGAAQLKVGPTTATSVIVGSATIPTTVAGTLSILGTIDTTAGVTLNVGPTTASSVAIGAAAIPTTVGGTLGVTGASTFSGNVVVSGG